jgi:hypothetical protein
MSQTKKESQANWKKLQRSGGLTHEQQFLMTALWRDVVGMPPPTNVNAEFKRNHFERYKEIKGSGMPSAE